MKIFVGGFIIVLKRIEGVRQFEQHVKLGTWEQTFVERKKLMLIVDGRVQG